MGLIRGLWAPFRGGVFVARHRLWGHIVVPLAINVFVAMGAGWLAAEAISRRFAYQGWLKWVAVVALGVIFFIVAQPILSAPFVDILTERVEIIVKGGKPQVGLFKSALSALWHGLLKTGLYLGALLLTLALIFFTGIGGVFGTIVTAVFLAYDGFDFPLARRDLGFSKKWAYLIANPLQTLGYAAGTSALYLVPLAVLVAPPFAAVGATLAFLDAEDVRIRKGDRATGSPEIRPLDAISRAVAPETLDSSTA